MVGAGWEGVRKLPGEGHREEGRQEGREGPEATLAAGV